jgi:YVTN family beta-propeller protein
MVVIVDAATLEVVGSMEAGTRPWGLAVHPSGERIYTANGPSNDVSVIDVASKSTIATIPSGGSPWGVTVVETPAR